MSYIERVVLARRQLLPAGGAAVRRAQRVPHALAAEDVTAAGRHHQAAALHDLRHRDTAAANQGAAVEETRSAHTQCDSSGGVSPLSRSPDTPDS